MTRRRSKGRADVEEQVVARELQRLYARGPADWADDAKWLRHAKTVLTVLRLKSKSRSAGGKGKRVGWCRVYRDSDGAHEIGFLRVNRNPRNLPGTWAEVRLLPPRKASARRRGGRK